MKKLNICAISDTHTKHEGLVIPACDILLHAGDFSGIGRISEVKNFLEWFSKQSAKHKIFISGNHDMMDQDNPSLFKEILKEYPGVTYLRDEMIEIEGIKIYGRPWTPEFYDWAFMKPRLSPSMDSTLSIIPSEVDILLTHGPAYGILDMTSRGERVGCEDMLFHLDRIKCKAVICGHIHHSSGTKLVNNILHINAAVLNDEYKQAFKPVLLEYINGKFQVL